MGQYWWRSWYGAATDHKWATIAHRANVQSGMVSAIAWALMDFAAQHHDRGSVEGFDIETYAIWSGFDYADIERVIDEMSNKGIIIDGKFAQWEKRQPQREDNSRGRVQAFRDRKRNESVTQCNDDETDVTQCNAVKRNVTQCNAPDTDTDTDTDVFKDNDKSLSSSQVQKSFSDDANEEDKIPRKKSELKFEPEHFELANFFHQLLCDTHPRFDIKTEYELMRWAHEIRIMVERQGYPLDEIREVMAWSQNSSFWAPNVMSIKKFRKQYLTLLSQMQNDRQKQHDGFAEHEIQAVRKSGFGPMTESEIPPPIEEYDKGKYADFVFLFPTVDHYNLWHRLLIHVVNDIYRSEDIQAIKDQWDGLYLQEDGTFACEPAELLELEIHNEEFQIDLEWSKLTPLEQLDREKPVAPAREKQYRMLSYQRQYG